MEELKAQAYEVLGSLDEEKLKAVLAYARSLRDGEEVLVADLEELLHENPA